MTCRVCRGLAAIASTMIWVAFSCGPSRIGPEEAGLSITDSLGRNVSLPAQAKKIISLEPEITRIIVALGEGERLVGIDYFLRYHDHLFPLVYPRSRVLPVVCNQGQDLNFEAALRLDSDLIFSSPSEFGMTESIERKLGVPVAALASTGKLRNLLQEITILGEIVDRKERAEELVAYFTSRLEAVHNLISSEARVSPPKTYLSFWGSLLRTPVSYEPVDAAGGGNLASGLLPSYLGTAGATVQLEDILLWNPDLILIQGNYPPAERLVTVEGVLSDPRLQTLRAVRTGRIHYTFGFWYWWDPALVLVETVYLARLFHPGIFPIFDLEREGNEIFEKFYGVADAFTELSAILKCDEWDVP